MDDGVDRLLNEVGRVVDDRIFETRREILGNVLHRVLDLLRRLDGVGTRQLENAEADGGLLVEIGVDTVVEAGKLDARHVFHADDRIA